MTYSVIDQDGNVVAGDDVLDDVLRKAADRYPGGSIRDDSTGKTVYQSDDKERPTPTLEELMAGSPFLATPETEEQS